MTDDVVASDELRETTAAGIRLHADECQVGIVLVTPEDLLIRYANPAFRRLVNAEDRLLVGKPFFDAFPALATDQLRTAVMTASDLSQPDATDVSLSLSDMPGSSECRSDLRITVSRVRDSSSEPGDSAAGLLLQVVEASSAGSTRSGAADVTADSAPAFDLVEVNQRLVLAALREQDLKERAEAANNAKSMFLATMSHELRTPLNAIIGYASLLDEGVWGPIEEAQHLHIERLKTSARHLLRLITDLLTLARVDADKEVVYTELVSSETIIDEAVSLTMPMAIAKRLEFAARSGDPFIIRTDRGKVLQILVNLIGNAIKFTDTGGIVLDVSVSGSSAEFRVSDTGIGISEENLPHVFDVFWQAEQELTRRAGGAGLGLNVSHRLAQLLGGGLRAQSRQGEGSTFTLILPLTDH